MKMILPLEITNSNLTATNIPQNDSGFPEWLVGTTYAAEDNVVVLGDTNKIYQSVQGSNTGNDPTTDDGTWWNELSATNRWKAFDNKLADQAEILTPNGIEYTITPEDTVTSIAFFNLEGVLLDVTITDTATGAVIFEESYSLVDTSEITDWYTYFTTTPSSDLLKSLIIPVPGYVGTKIEIKIDNSSSPVPPARVGEIVLGREVTIGRTNYGTNVSILDFSRKETDTFGNFIIIERAFQDEVNFRFQLETGNIGKVKSMLASRRAKPTVYFSDYGQDNFGALAFGYYEDFDIPITGPALSFGTLEVRGLS